jgi:hypothetical protein
VTEELSHDGKAKTSASTHAREGMPEVVKPDTIKPGMSRDSSPRLLEIGARLGLLSLGRRPTGDHELAQAWNALHNSEGRGVENDRLAAGLAIREQQEAPLKIDLRPT